MLFSAANVYAPGEAGTPPSLGQSGYQDMSLLGRYNLGGLQPPNWLIGVLGLLVIAWAWHRYHR